MDERQQITEDNEGQLTPNFNLNNAILVYTVGQKNVPLYSVNSLPIFYTFWVLLNRMNVLPSHNNFFAFILTVAGETQDFNNSTF